MRVYRESGDEDPRVSSLFMDQEQIQTKELFDCFKTAFSGLSHLRRVAVADLSRTVGLLGDVVDLDGGPLIKRLLPGTVQGETQPYNTGVCCAISKDLKCSSHGSTFRRQFGGIMQLIQVLASSDLPSFDSLSLGNGTQSYDSYGKRDGHERPSYGGISNWCFNPANGLSFELLQAVFPRLRSLDLTICFADKGTESNHDTVWASPRAKKTHLRTLLDKAVVLEVLKLSGQVDTGHLDLENTLPENGLRKLRVLELTCCVWNYSDLTGFLLRHRDTIRRVKIDCFSLLDGAWEDLQAFMPLNVPETSSIWGFTWQHGRPLPYPDNNISDVGNWDDVLFGTEYQYLDEDTGVWAGIDNEGSISSEDLEYASGSDHEDLDLELLAREGVENYTQQWS